MTQYARLYFTVLLLALAGFVYGAASLFLARYSRGDVYPAYSSFRADPLGTRAFFEALQSLPGVDVERNIDPLEQAAGNRTITFFVNGLVFGRENNGLVTSTEIDGGLARDLQKIIDRGGRVVLSFAPVTRDIAYDEEMDKEFQERMDERWSRKPRKEEGARGEDGTSADGSAKPGEASNRPENKRDESLTGSPPSDPSGPAGSMAEKEGEEKDRDDPDGERKDRWAAYTEFTPEPVTWDDEWGVQLRFRSMTRDSATRAFSPSIARRAVDAPLPAELPIHTALYFAPSSDTWHTLYSVDNRDVVIERSYGAGSLVLVADAYPLSNEAMRAERHPDFLAWLAGPNRAIYFDETTLGTRRARGMVSLMWEYRLQGVVVALIVLAVLYIWKNGQPLVPPFDDSLPEDAFAYAGKTSASGFANLLRRSVPQPDILRTCLAEWEKSFGHRSAELTDSVRDAKAVVLREDSKPAAQRDIVRAYQDMCAAFARHRLG